MFNIFNSGPTGAQASFLNVIATLGNAVNMLLPIAMVLVAIAFFYGLAIYVFNSGEEDKRTEGKSIMAYGAVAMFVAFSIWGIIGYLQNFFGTDRGAVNQTIVLPNVVMPRIQ